MWVPRSIFHTSAYKNKNRLRAIHYNRLYRYVDSAYCRCRPALITVCISCNVCSFLRMYNKYIISLCDSKAATDNLSACDSDLTWKNRNLGDLIMFSVIFGRVHSACTKTVIISASRRHSKTETRFWFAYFDEKERRWFLHFWKACDLSLMIWKVCHIMYCVNGEYSHQSLSWYDQTLRRFIELWRAFLESVVELLFRVTWHVICLHNFHGVSTAYRYTRAFVEIDKKISGSTIP